MKEKNIRKIALNILDHLEETDGYSNLVVNKLVHKDEMSYQDKRFISNLVYGVLENRIFLDYVIRKYSSIRLKKIQGSTLNILRMGAYQLIFLDKVPDSAAVNESVILVKKANPRSTGFVNGILRSMVREKDNLPLPKRDDDLVEYLSVKYSHSKWIVEKFIGDFGEEFAEGILQANNNKPLMNIRANTLKNTREELILKLEAIGMGVSASKFNKSGIIVNSFDESIVNVDLYKEGCFVIQDNGSMLISEILDPKPGERVLDVCSAPGGKTTHIAELMQNKGIVVARDIYDHKLELVNNSVNRLGILIVETDLHDGTLFKESEEKSYDKVLLDAPCSGFGIIRRKPEIKYNKSLDDVISLSSLQYEMLVVNSKYLKVGGEMIYSTCSINKEENENVVDKFVKENDEFEIVDISDKISTIDIETKTITLYQSFNETDGYFICKLKRIK
ncbi:MAG: 16S rRNA (cytosine(967)-C(5))-methyltransferase RsmB [Acidaminobacteraceae bacterium]